jgi:hypothetical protein
LLPVNQPARLPGHTLMPRRYSIAGQHKPRGY